jgi:hypothetical protein
MVCRQYQISHSRFYGGNQRWTEVDRAYAVAYERWLAARHGPCGTRHDDWFDDDGYPLEEPVWETSVEECQGCIEIARAQRSIEEGSDGLYVTMKPFGSSPMTDEDHP